jgi:uncharacterized protein (TIGR03435 family)
MEAKRYVFRTVLGLVVFAAMAWAQAPTSSKPMSFEVASVKASPALDPMKMAQQMQQGVAPHIGMKVDGARVDIGYMSLTDIIGNAYKVKKYQISGPDWMGSQRFDILAKLPDGASKDQVPEMLQDLLIQRFKLAVHHESKEQPVYELGVGKNGPKLKESPPDPEPAAGAANGVPSVKNDGNGTFTVTGGQNGPTRVSMTPDGQVHLEASKMSMAQLADTLTNLVGRPVVDKTGLTGNYQVSLTLSMSDIRAAAASAGMNIPTLAGAGASTQTPTAAADPSGSAMFSVIQDLGLKLESKKSPLDTIVVDHIEKVPTEN